VSHCHREVDSYGLSVERGRLEAPRREDPESFFLEVGFHRRRSNPLNVGQLTGLVEHSAKNTGGLGKLAMEIELGLFARDGNRRKYIAADVVDSVLLSVARGPRGRGTSDSRQRYRKRRRRCRNHGLRLWEGRRFALAT
jgi:hypothetical protein